MVHRKFIVLLCMLGLVASTAPVTPVGASLPNYPVSAPDTTAACGLQCPHLVHLIQWFK